MSDDAELYVARAMKALETVRTPGHTGYTWDIQQALLAAYQTGAATQSVAPAKTDELVTELSALADMEAGWYANVGAKTGERACRAMRMAATVVREYDRLFAMQQRRMSEATVLWREETGRHGIMPDLGALLQWLMEKHGDLPEVALRALGQLALESHRALAELRETKPQAAPPVPGGKDKLFDDLLTLLESSDAVYFAARDYGAACDAGGWASAAARLAHTKLRACLAYYEQGGGAELADARRAVVVAARAWLKMPTSDHKLHDAVRALGDLEEKHAQA